MNDEAQIQRTINTYSQVASLVQIDKVLALYQPDAVWAVPSQGVRAEGHAEIAAQMTLFASSMEFVLQGNSPAVVEVNGDTATARTSIRETGKVAGQDMGFEYIGIYADKLVRTPDGWKFAERICEVIGGMTYPINKLSV